MMIKHHHHRTCRHRKVATAAGAFPKHMDEVDSLVGEEYPRYHWHQVRRDQDGY
jgi:hypothetical protein